MAARDAQRPLRPETTPQTRGILAGGALFQPTTTSFVDQNEFPYFREAASLAGEYSVGDGFGFDVGGVFRVWRALGLGIGVTKVSLASSGVFTGGYPHPFFFDRTRAVTADLSDLTRDELGLHLSAAYVVPSGRRFQLVFFGGPSLFKTEQDVASDFDVAEVYPFDSVGVTVGTVTKLEQNVIGIHGGADVAWFFFKNLGIGALARYSVGSKTVSVGDGEDFELKVGGAHAAVGLRVRF